MNSPMRHAALSSLCLLMLAACGGGGGTSGTAAPATADPLPVAAPTVARLSPGTNMSWSTTRQLVMEVLLRLPDGARAAGAAVRVFTLSRTSPQDGSALIEPVPAALLETDMTGPDGRATVPLRLPGHVTEVLVVATYGDFSAQRALPVDVTPISAELALAR